LALAVSLTNTDIKLHEDNSDSFVELLMKSWERKNRDV
jgi:hypothetical protein